MIYFPNAKINLGLSVIKKRNDGKHNIETCYVPVPLYDVLEVIPSKKFSLKQVGVPIDCNPNNNLITKAWKLLLEFNKDITPVDVCLFKNIPVGSGLGGGSSDAAFFIKAINNSCSLGLSLSDLEHIASKVGADCPFFINNSVTIAKGVGNIFSPIINPVSGMFITIVFPNISIFSKNAYADIKPQSSQNVSLLLNGCKSIWKHELKNDFESYATTKFPELLGIKDSLYEIGAIYVSLTGSGSAIFALSDKHLNTNIFKNKYKIWSKLLT